METLYIIGFMGAGKTTLAKQLAKQEQYSIIDLDHYIEQKVKQPIAQYIQVYGMGAFRQQEEEALKELNNTPVDIISCGGGIIESEVNRRYLKKKRVLYLESPFNVLYQRICHDTIQRPLVMMKTKEELFALYQQRELIYNEVATYTISSNVKEEVVLKNVKRWLEEVNIHR